MSIDSENVSEGGSSFEGVNGLAQQCKMIPEARGGNPDLLGPFSSCPTGPCALIQTWCNGQEQERPRRVLAETGYHALAQAAGDVSPGLRRIVEGSFGQASSEVLA